MAVVTHISQLGVSINFLRKIPVFSSLPDEKLKRLTEKSQLKDYERKSFIFQQEDIIDYVCVLTKGIVAMVMQKESGSDHIISFKTCYDLFGITHIFDNESEKLSALALGKCSILLIPKNILKELLLEPSFCVNFLKLVLGLEKEYLEKIAIMTFKTTSERAKAVFRLLELKFPTGKPREIKVSTLAEYASVWRESFERDMPPEKKKNYDTERNNEIVVRMENREELEQIASDYGIKDIRTLYRIYEYLAKSPYPFKRKQHPTNLKLARNIEIVTRMDSGESIESIAEGYGIKDPLSLYRIYKMTARKPFQARSPSELIERNNEIVEMMDSKVDLCVILRKYKIKYLNSLFRIYETVRGKSYDLRPVILKQERNRKIMEMAENGEELSIIAQTFGLKFHSLKKIIRRIRKTSQRKSERLCLIGNQRKEVR